MKTKKLVASAPVLESLAATKVRVVSVNHQTGNKLKELKVRCKKWT